MDDPRTSKILYIGALYCLNRLKILTKESEDIIKNYDKLLLLLGINGRFELCERHNINPSQYISPQFKGFLKIQKIEEYVNSYKIRKDSVYIIDDTPDVIDYAIKNEINGYLTTPEKSLEYILEEIYNSNMYITMIFIDFDKTLSLSKFRKRWLSKSTEDIISHYFGGMERISKIKEILKRFEKLNVHIGIISGQTSELISEILQRINLI